MLKDLSNSQPRLVEAVSGSLRPIHHPQHQCHQHPRTNPTESSPILSDRPPQSTCDRPPESTCGGRTHDRLPED